MAEPEMEMLAPGEEPPTISQVREAARYTSLLAGDVLEVYQVAYPPNSYSWRLIKVNGDTFDILVAEGTSWFRRGDAVEWAIKANPQCTTVVVNLDAPAEEAPLEAPAEGEVNV